MSSLEYEIIITIKITKQKYNRTGSKCVHANNKKYTHTPQHK